MHLLPVAPLATILALDSLPAPGTESLDAAPALGDIDGDGVDDLLLGASEEHALTGQGAVWWAPGGADGLDLAGAEALSVTLSAEQILGRGVGLADMNGDGALDLAATVLDGESSEHILLWTGAAGGPGDAVPAEIVPPFECASRVDWSYDVSPTQRLTSLGDTNGDGLADLGFHTWSYDDRDAPAYETCGLRNVLLGDAVEPGADGVLLNLYVRASGEDGECVSAGLGAAGDLDGDGYDDAVVGCPEVNDGTGALSVYLGTLEGTDTYPAQDLVLPPFRALGERTSALGDRDGDGHAELAVTAYADAYVWIALAGQPGGLDEVPLRVERLGEADTRGATAGLLALDLLFGAGDLDGDGLLDLVYAQGDVKGDTPLMALSGAGPLEEPAQLSLAGSTFAAGEHGPARHGDVNGDGLDDVVWTRPTASLDAQIAQVLSAPEEDDEVDDEEPASATCLPDLDDDGAAGSGEVLSADADCDDAGEASAEVEADCDDADPTVSPHAPERPGDGVDQDCDGVERCYVDADGDGYRPDGGALVVGVGTACDGPGEALASQPDGDCDDGDPAVSPGASELAGDGVDQDCDGTERCAADADHDGYRPDEGEELESEDDDCDDLGEAWSSQPAGDCDDRDDQASPEGVEVPGDGVDQDCDGGDLPADGAESPGCATGGGRVSWLALLPLLALLRRSVVSPGGEPSQEAGGPSMIKVWALLLAGCTVERGPAAERRDVETNIISHQYTGTYAYDDRAATLAGEGYGASGGGDADGDGNADALLFIGPSSSASSASAAGVDLFLGPFNTLYVADEDLRFPVPSTSSAYARTWGDSASVEGDADGDGQADVWIAWSSERMLYLVTDGSETPADWSSVSSAPGGATVSRRLTVPGDMDGDGLDEAAQVYAVSSAGTAQIFAGSTLGLDEPLSVASPSGLNASGATLAPGGDLNADGYADLLLGTPGGTGALSEILGGADLSAAVWTKVREGASREALGASVSTAGDYDGDGYDDVVAGSSGAETVSILLSDGTGALTLTRTLDSESDDPTGLGGLVVGGQDLDQDGYSDLIYRDYHDDEDDRTRKYNVVAFSMIHSSVGHYVDPSLSRTFASSVVMTPDLDGDAFPDVLITGATTGGVSLYRGYADADEDGFSSRFDCDDADDGVHPLAEEDPASAGDQDCDGYEICAADADVDGFRGEGEVASEDADCEDPGEADPSASEDCDDADAAVYAGATELPGDGVDADCDGVERCYVDADADGYRTDETEAGDADCEDPREALASAPDGDCDDADERVHPGADEGVGDGVDQDCDGAERCYADADADGFTGGDTVSGDLDCVGALDASAPDGDCDDADATVHPGAEESPGDGLDTTCDGRERCFIDADGDGHRTTSPLLVWSEDADCEDAGEALATLPADDCDDADPAVISCAEADSGEEPSPGCSAGGGRSGPWGLALALALAARRARARSDRGRSPRRRLSSIATCYPC